jgi:hypothetical protein
LSLDIIFFRNKFLKLLGRNFNFKNVKISRKKFYFENKIFLIIIFKKLLFVLEKLKGCLAKTLLYKSIVCPVHKCKRPLKSAKVA